MKLRTKATIFFGAFLFAIALSIFLYAQFIVGGIFKKQATNNLRIIAEQSESIYLAFLGSIKVRALDWTSDPTIRDITKTMLSAPEGSPERSQAAKKFGTYLTESKMPFDKTISVVDLLDRNGIVIASTRPERIGEDEKNEEVEHRKVHDFVSTINSKFGEVFFGTILIDGAEGSGTTMNATVRLFDIKKGGEHTPLDAVTLVYLSNATEVADILGSGKSVYTGSTEQAGRLTNRALVESYSTSDIYLVNSERILVTPTRSIKDTSVKQKIDTLPVRECLENGKEISEEYYNYQGTRVLGASMCFRDEGIVLLVEVASDEIFAPLITLTRDTVLGGIVALILGTIIVLFFVQKNLSRINNIILVARRVAGGDLSTGTEVTTKDELGYLASAFNTMLASVRDNQENLETAKRNVEKEKVKDEALLVSIGEGILATDDTGRITLMNRVAERIIGWSVADVIGKKATEVILVMDENGKMVPPEEHAISTTLATGTTVMSNTMQYVHKITGKHTPVAVMVNPVILEGKLIGALATFRDITKEKEIEQMRVDLLSLASHQLRTPLSGTKWLIETLRKGIHGPLTKEQKEYLDEIYKINEHMTSLVFDMLSALRIESGSGLFKQATISIASLFDAVATTMASAAKAKNITLHIDKTNADIMITTAPELLRNVLESFVSNAITYSLSDKEVWMSLKKESSAIIISVKDSGIGIPAVEQSQIFKRFYRASNAKTFDTRGSGLGLYIASMLAKKIGVLLSFESGENKGSTFFVHIPHHTLE